MHNAPSIFRCNLYLYRRGCCIFLTELAQESWRDLAAVLHVRNRHNTSPPPPPGQGGGVAGKTEFASQYNK